MNRRPPERIWVSWCQTCGAVVIADRKRHDTSCHSCPVDQGRIVGVRYMVERKNGEPQIDEGMVQR